MRTTSNVDSGDTRVIIISMVLLWPSFMSGIPLSDPPANLLVSITMCASVSLVCPILFSSETKPPTPKKGASPVPLINGHNFPLQLVVSTT